MKICDYCCFRKVNEINFFPQLIDIPACCQRDWFEVRKQPCQIVSRQRGQQFIGEQPIKWNCLRQSIPIRRNLINSARTSRNHLEETRRLAFNSVRVLSGVNAQIPFHHFFPCSLLPCSPILTSTSHAYFVHWPGACRQTLPTRSSSSALRGNHPRLPPGPQLEAQAVHALKQK